VTEPFDKPQQLTVAALREKLADFPDDALVLSDGCDCVGPATDVFMLESHEGDAVEVLISR